MDVEQLNENEGREGDGGHVGERVREEDDGAKDDHATLEDGHPKPDEEGLKVQGTTLL